LPLHAGQEPARIPIIDAKPGTPGLGGGLRFGSGPYIGEASDRLDLVPLYLYEGKHLFAHGTSAGVHLYRNKRFMADLFARYRFLGVDPGDDPALEGLAERDQTVDAGLSVGTRGKWGQLRLEWLTEVLDKHNGQEASLIYRYEFERGRWSFSPYAGIVWQDAEFTDYYFGVDPDEAGPLRPEYTPGDAFNFQYGLNTSYAVNSRFMVFANLGLEELDTSIQDSPIVEPGINGAVFVGGSYFFGNVFDPTVPADGERKGEWTWRLNYGYQADGNIVGEINHGDFEKSENVSTQIGGVTFGKLLNAGPRVEFFGRLALFRHFEEPYQDNFNSYAAYIMAMGKGYLGWSGQPTFRWGFGFGFNYAEKIPAEEVISQGNKGNESQQFLNYLEMQLDFPFRLMTKAKALKRCWTGITLVHRSGIFATSDFLGNVFGGSDWITLHVECTR
jgi:outer membrane scaffolding protein for murein synthesis (MipA/OmpV family)